MRLTQDFRPPKNKGNAWTMTVLAVLAFIIGCLVTHYFIVPYLVSLGL